MYFDFTTESVTAMLVGPVFHILIILLIMLVTFKIATMTANRVFRHFLQSQDSEVQKRAETMSSIIKYIAGIVIITVGIIMILGEMGVDIGPLLATAGVLGVAVGFGSQHLVQDVISGFFILLDDEIRVGDVVEVSGKGGLVERINLRMTVLRDLAGNVHYIRNGHIDIVTNMTKVYSRYVFDIGVAYREDVDEVMDVIRAVDEELRADPEFAEVILEPIEIFGLDQFADSALIIKARTKTKPIQQWRVGREFKRRLKKRFDEKGIEIPFPHVTLYMGQDKDGSAPSMHVAMNRNI